MDYQEQIIISEEEHSASSSSESETELGPSPLSSSLKSNNAETPLNKNLEPNLNTRTTRSSTSRNQHSFEGRSWSYFYKNIHRAQLPKKRERKLKYSTFQHLDLDENDLNEEEFVNQFFDEEKIQKWNTSKKQQEDLINKGCMLFHGSENLTKQEKQQFQKLEELHGFTKLLDGLESTKFVRARFNLYQETWNTLNEAINAFQKKLNYDSLDLISNFLIKTRDFEYLGIPTALIFGGLSILDQDIGFKELSEYLSTKKNLNVATLHSQDCPTFKALVNQITNQFLKISEKCGMESISAWYLEQSLSSPLVFIFQDFECFDSEVLQTFIQVASEFQMNGIPVAFVFGLATSSESIQRILPQSSSKLLFTEKFQFQAPTKVVHYIIELFLLKNICPIKIGAQPLEFLIQNFTDRNFSVHSFIQGIKYILMQHFHQNPLSFLCTDKFVYELSLEPVHMQYLRTLPSLSTQAKKLTDEKLKKSLVGWINDFLEFQRSFPYFYQCYLKLTSFYSLIDPFQSYLVLLKCDPTQFSAISTCIRSLSPVQIEQFLQAWYGIFHKNKVFSNWEKEVTSLLEKLTQIQHQVLQTIQEEKPIQQENTVVNNKKISAKKRRELQMSSVQSSTQNSFDLFRKQVQQFTQKFLETCFKSYTQFPAFEIFVWNDYKTLVHAFFPFPRKSLSKALSTPRLYLHKHDSSNSKCCLNGIDDSLEDLCIAYQLYGGYGKLINLYDWLLQFCGCVSDEENITNELQARFSQAIGELNFLGLIQKTKKKTDHVSKTTF